MTIREAIDRADALKPNTCSDDIKMAWLSEVDFRIFNDIYETHEGNTCTLGDPLPWQTKLVFPYADDQIVLLAEAPYDILYPSYIQAKIDEHNEETTRYANSAAVYNSQYQDYARFYNRTHMPIQPGRRPVPPVPPMPPVTQIDEHPSPTSTNPVMSCGIYEAIQPKADKTELPTSLADLESDSTHKTITAADEARWDAKQDALTFDNAPTAGSSNPVKSGGVYSALQNKADASAVPANLEDLSNVAITSPTNGQVLKYSGGGWYNANESGGGTTVIANPTLAGTEDDLTSIQIGDTKYKVEGGSGTSDYDDLTDKPQIGGVTLSGNKSLAELGIEAASVSVTGTLTAGQTGITLSNAAITTDSTIDIYTDAYGVNPSGVTVVNGSITLTFTAQLTNLGVKAVIR